MIFLSSALMSCCVSQKVHDDESSKLRIQEFDCPEAAAEYCKANKQSKFYHALPLGGVEEIVSTDYFKRHLRPYFVGWFSLLGRCSLTEFQKHCFDIHEKIQWVDLPLPGASLVPNFVSEDEAASLIRVVDSLPWQCLLKRRVQHYGHAFVYQKLYIDTMRNNAPPIPPCIAEWLLPRIEGVAGWTPDQLTINEYLPGQGIGFHVDTHSAFGPAICVVSLLSGLDMTFRNDEKGETRRRLDRNSLLIFGDEARYGWLHGIKSRKTDDDCQSGEPISRGRRVSLTFRRLNWENNFQCHHCGYPELCDTQNPASLILPDHLAPQ